MIKAERTKSLVKRRKSFDFIFSDIISGMAAQLLNRLGQLGVGLAVGGAVINSALFNVDGGHRAVIFDKFAGVKQAVVGEGTHFMIPWVQQPIIYDIRARPKNVPTITGSKDLQNVNITLRILFRPKPDALPWVRTMMTGSFHLLPTRSSKPWWPSLTLES